MANGKDKIYYPMYIVSVTLFLTMLYWYGYEVWYRMGLTHMIANNFFLKFADAGLFDNEFKYKIVLTTFIILSVIAKNGKETDVSWGVIIAIILAGVFTFFFPFRSALMFVIWSTTGYALLNLGFALLGRKVRGYDPNLDDADDTFDQCRKKMTNKYSINLKTRFQYHGRMRRGWINIVAPFRACLIMGTPGSGKSFSAYNQIIQQMIQKDYTAFLYDYKFPDLTEEIYNRYLQKYAGKKKKPKFCVINFDDPRMSMRCNPLDARYLTEMTDAHEVADLIMKNINPDAVEREDFFTMSAKVFIAACIWLLKKYKGGIYCSFPHLIELLGKSYETTFKIMQEDEELSVMIQPFADALKGKAQEQLQGQIASARIPLLRFPSAALYWTLTGDDFSLDLNNPDDPKIICMGNNPDRQAIYGTAIALYTMQMFKVINHRWSTSGKRNLHCGVLLDELPTIFIKGLDNLIATARSNLVAIFLGAQDISQLIRDYREKEADVITNTIGNIVSGQVNGRTAKSISETLGKEYREQKSVSSSKDSTSVSRSMHLVECVSQSRIETLSQGMFVGKVADNNDQKIQKKLFCAEILVDMKEREEFQANWVKIPKFGEVHEVGKNPETGEPVYEGYFNDAAIEKRVRRDPDKHIIEYLYIKEKEDYYREKKRDPEHAQTYSDDELRAKAQMSFNLMQPEEREKILGKVIKRAQDDEVQRILIENYQRIRQDVDELFAYYGYTAAEAEGAATVNQAPSAPAGATPSGANSSDVKEQPSGIPAGDIMDLSKNIEEKIGEEPKWADEDAPISEDGDEDGDDLEGKAKLD